MNPQLKYLKTLFQVRWEKNECQITWRLTHIFNLFGKTEQLRRMKCIYQKTKMGFN